MKEYTVPGWQANLVGLFFIIPIVLIAGIPYILIQCGACGSLLMGLQSAVAQNAELIRKVSDFWWLLLPVPAAGIILHETIHGVMMASFCKGGWKSVSFGFNLTAFAPYAHCKEPLKPYAYRLSLIMPGLVLGDIPVLISWFTGNILFLIFGIFFIWTAAGDIIILWMSWKIDGGLLQDHPEKIGFIQLTA
jgi:hypothetical protein